MCSSTNIAVFNGLKFKLLSNKNYNFSRQKRCLSTSKNLTITIHTFVQETFHQLNKQQSFDYDQLKYGMMCHVYNHRH